MTVGEALEVLEAARARSNREPVDDADTWEALDALAVHVPAEVIDAVWADAGYRGTEGAAGIGRSQALNAAINRLRRHLPVPRF